MKWLDKTISWLKRATTGPTFTMADYERFVLANPEWRLGMGDSELEALGIPAIWQAILLVSGDMAKLPLQKVIVGDQGREVLHQSHPTWSLVHDEPTPGIGAMKWWRRFNVQLLLWANAYARIIRNGAGRPIRLQLLESAMVQHQLDDDGEVGFWYVNARGNFEFIRAGDVLHVEDLSLQRATLDGRSQTTPVRLLTNARNHFQLSLMIERYGTKFFENGGRMGGWLQLPRQMTKGAKDNYEKNFRDTYESAESMFKTIIYRGKDEVKFGTFGQAKPDETQMTDSRKQQRLDAASLWNIPPHKLGDDSRLSYNSLEQENRSYLDSTLSPRLAAIQDESRIKLLFPRERSTGRHKFKHDVTELLRTDMATSVTVATGLYQASLAKKNEARKIVGLEPVKDGDEFLETPVGGVPNSSGSEPNEPPDEPEEQDNLRFVRIPLVDSLERALSFLHGVAERKARHQSPTEFAHWLEYRLEDNAEAAVRVRIQASIKAYAGASGQDERQLFARAFSAICAEVRSAMRNRSALVPERESVLLLERIENVSTS